MSTKLKLKRPSFVSRPPKGWVYLGPGRDELTEAKNSPFYAKVFTVDDPRWDTQNGPCSGSFDNLYYAAPRDSAIAREILGVKESPKSKPRVQRSKSIGVMPAATPAKEESRLIENLYTKISKEIEELFTISDI